MTLLLRPPRQDGRCQAARYHRQHGFLHVALRQGHHQLDAPPTVRPGGGPGRL